MRFLARTAVVLALISPLAVAEPPIVPGAELLLEMEHVDFDVGAGVVLLSELGCVTCHQAGDNPPEWLRPKRAPDLSNVGARIKESYLRAFVESPHTTKPGTTMPDLMAWLPEDSRIEVAESLTHFLAAQGGPFDTQPVTGIDQLKSRGDDLFHTVGCVACHAPRRDAKPVTNEDGQSIVERPVIHQASVPLPDLQEKTRPTQLAKFLKNPLAIRPSGRMPNMKLNEDEALAIAVYLSGQSTAQPQERRTLPDPERVREGGQLFVSMGCVACHGDKIAAPYLRDITPLAALRPESNPGCLSTVPKAGHPSYPLDDRQRSALQLVIGILQRNPPDSMTADFTLAQLNCYACHAREVAGNPIGGIEPGRAAYFETLVDKDLGEEGRIPPHLTGVGAKLTREWLEKILTDGGEVRPYLAVRMPHFGREQVEPLIEQLREDDADPTPLPVDVSGLEHHHRNMYGRQLLGTDGMGCINCHGLKGAPSLGMPALDLATVPERLQPSWFMKYMLDPAAVFPRTRMPAFFENGKSAFTSLWGGDAKKQIEAIWIYLRELDQTRLPVGMEGNTDYELVPKDEPIVLRTFMKDVGTRAIAVGYPQGVHAAFDAERARFAYVWKGNFLDAESTWSDRFSPLAEPLGEIIWRFPENPWPEQPRYLGYRLGADREPTFRYTVSGVEIEDTLRSLPDGNGWQRTLMLRGNGENISFLAGTSDAIKQRSADTFAFGDEITMRMQTDAGNETNLRELNGKQEILVFITASPEGVRIEQEVRW